MKIMKAIRVSLLLATFNAAGVFGTPLTQEQLAQYVAAQQTQQQTAPAAQRYVTAAVPRQTEPVYQRQQDSAAYQDEQEYNLGPEYDAGGGGHQPILYYRQQQQPQPRPLPQYKKYPAAAKLRTDQLYLGGSKEKQPEDYDPNPQYQFSFDIKDDESTNYHNRKETRDGDKISGSYSVVDSDGYIRTVTYTADPKEGFKADVNRQPTDIVVKLPQHPTPGLAQQYQQLPQAPTLVARKQQTQQYLEASSPIDSGDPQQYAIKPQQVYIQPGRSAAAAPGGGGVYFSAPHRLSPASIPVAVKSPKAYSPIHQSAGASPLLYRQAYQQ